MQALNKIFVIYEFLTIFRLLKKKAPEGAFHLIFSY